MHCGDSVFLSSSCIFMSTFYISLKFISYRNFYSVNVKRNSLMPGFLVALISFPFCYNNNSEECGRSYWKKINHTIKNSALISSFGVRSRHLGVFQCSLV